MGSDINTTAWEPSACFSADGNTIYFVSDRKGGLGGRDLWKVVKLPNGEWSKASNLGAPINTPYDEDGPFMHPDGKTLYFASNGHKTMGGFDIFGSTYFAEENTWTQPENVGYPVSTTDDDVFFVTSADGRRAYYSSTKEGGFGDKDLYMITYPEIEAKSIAILIGKIVNPAGGDLLANNKITVTDLTAGDSPIDFKANAKTGKYVLTLKPGRSYNISYSANGTEFYNEKVDVPASSDYQEIRREVSLNPVTIGTPKDMPKDTTKAIAKTEPKKVDEPKKNYVSDGTNIQVFFDYNVKTIKTTDKDFVTFIDKLSSILKENPSLKINIEGSASKVPTGDFYKTNENLASTRASETKSKIVASLKVKGVPTDKIKFNTKGVVQGPEYNNDANKSRKEYEKYQYVKITLE
jgi:outer membrane protein OmpA-like peptidoglycan-associated protein